MRRLLFALLISFPICSSIACGDSYDNDSATTVTPAPVEKVSGGQPPLPMIEIELDDGATLRVEVADDATERGSGLSGRSGLAENSGMLFVWEDAAAHTIWMKGMLFDLDLVWLDEEGKVVSVDEYVPAQGGVSDGQLTQYHPARAAKYAIELEAGMAAAHGVDSGDTLLFQGLTD